MAIEIVFNETMEAVEAAVQASLESCGFKVKPAPLADGVVIKSKMSCWIGERGNGVLSMVLPFLFKTEQVGAVIAAYQDGTTGLRLRPEGTHGGSLASEAMYRATGGMTVISRVGAAADQNRNEVALGKRLTEIETTLRQRLGAKIAYEGPVRGGVEPVPA